MTASTETAPPATVSLRGMDTPWEDWSPAARAQWNEIVARVRAGHRACQTVHTAPDAGWRLEWLAFDDGIRPAAIIDSALGDGAVALVFHGRDRKRQSAAA